MKNKVSVIRLFCTLGYIVSDAIEYFAKLKQEAENVNGKVLDVNF